MDVGDRGVLPMWEKLRVIFTIPELRQKILLTLALLGVYRIGYQIPLPMVNAGSGGGSGINSIPSWKRSPFSPPPTCVK